MKNLNDQEKPTKILIMGLDNCGKTSILISLRKDANILTYFSLRPTKGVTIKKFQKESNEFICRGNKRVIEPEVYN